MNQTTFAPLATNTRSNQAHAATPTAARDLYFALQDDPAAHAAQARVYLERSISAVQQLPLDLPDELRDFEAWSLQHVEAVGQAYRDYLDMRKAGGARRYFTTRSHALHFLKAAAPTKLVDGAWLYGVLPYWENPQYHGLIRTYLEELGDGAPDQNHVVIYQKLLAAHACDEWQHLSDDHFTQGALQLALAHNADFFLPELIGYNLGYEQLPLHLLISAYELNELGIDPYYFTLHVTIDNAANGHARKAIDALTALAPTVGDKAAFQRRVRDGYRLNELGASTLSMIAGFDLEAELLAILRAKAVFGKNMHSDYCMVAGRSVNAWLDDPKDLPQFLAALVSAGWIKRGEPAENSRFWALVDGPRASMFGVFSSYELQVLRDWISADMDATRPRTPSHRAQLRALSQLAVPDPRPASAPRGLIRRHVGGDEAANSELRQLEMEIASLPGKDAAMRALRPLMAPHLHHTPAGLMATRMYARLLDL